LRFSPIVICPVPGFSQTDTCLVLSLVNGSPFQAPEIGHADIDHEAAAGLEVLGDVPETWHRGGLGRQVLDRIPGEICEAERAICLGDRESRRS
jgi:hypothetical protein